MSHLFMLSFIWFLADLGFSQIAADPFLNLQTRPVHLPQSGGRYDIEFNYSPSLIMIFPNEDAKSLTIKLEKSLKKFRMRDLSKKTAAGLNSLHIFIALSAYQRLYEEKKYHQNVVFWNRKQRSSRQPRPAFQDSLKTLKKFELFIKKAKLPLADPMVRFSLGYIHSYLDKMEKSNEYLKPLTKLGKHRLQTLSHIFLIENAFKQNNLELVEKYLKALESDDSVLLSWSYYRLGRVLYENRKIGLAVKNFEKSYNIARERKYLTEFRHHVQWVWVSSLTRTMTFKEVLQIYEKNRLTPEFLEQAESLFSDRGQIEKAEKTISHLLREEGYSKRRPEMLRRQINYSIKLKRWDRIWSAVRSFLDHFEHWKTRNLDASLTKNEIAHWLEQAVILAHRQGLISPSPSLWRQLVSGYTAYIEYFPKNPRAGLMKYRLADVYMRLGNFELAAMTLKNLLSEDHNKLPKLQRYPAALKLMRATLLLMADSSLLNEREFIQVVQESSDACLVFMKLYPLFYRPVKPCFDLVDEGMKRLRLSNERRDFLESFTLISYRTPLGLDALKMLLNNSREYDPSHQQRLARLWKHQASQHPPFKKILKDYGDRYE